MLVFSQLGNKQLVERLFLKEQESRVRCSVACRPPNFEENETMKRLFALCMIFSLALPFAGCEKKAEVKKDTPAATTPDAAAPDAGKTDEAPK